MMLKELVRRAPITIDSSATLYDVVKIMAEQNIGFIVVLENGRMVEFCLSGMLCGRWLRGGTLM